MTITGVVLELVMTRPIELILLLLVVLQRVEFTYRLQECEDAHLVRDQIQLDLVRLTSEQSGAFELLGNSRRAIDKELAARGQKFREQATAIARQIRQLNDDMLGRRRHQRRWLARLLVFLRIGRDHKEKQDGAG